MRGLLAEQFADLADLDLVEPASGWDNAIFRLGHDLTVRLPRRALSAELVEHEQRWLPALAERLPLPIPVPLRFGRPSFGYPWRWSVCPWFAGDPATRVPPDDAISSAATLGAFVGALNQPAPRDAPANPYRGIPLARRTERLHSALDALGTTIDGSSVRALWSDLVNTPPWVAPPVWLHGDLHPGNVLVHDGQIAAVIDFGDLTAGDPATDLAVAWMLFPPEARPRFRAAAGGCDDDTWARARGWALALSVAYIAGSADNPEFTDLGQQVVASALGDD